jgi:hypothetical protein
MNYPRLIFLGLVVISVGCGQIGGSAEQRQARATWEAEQYPWAVYPISEESKAALCQTLGLLAEDDFCQEGTEVRHEDVFAKVKEVFPINQTTYDEVEARLGDFPHLVEESRQPDGTLVGLWHIYRLTEYRGACIYFQIDLKDNRTIEKIGATSLGSGPSPTTCGPSE